MMLQKCIAMFVGLLLPISLGSTASDHLVNDGQLVFCESQDGAYLECSTEYVIDKVEMDFEISNKKCVEDVSWGYSMDYVWVNESCRGGFRVFAKAR